MGEHLTFRWYLLTNGNDPYPCYKCNDGFVTKEGDKGVCVECGEICLHNMDNAEASAPSVVVSK